MVYAIDCGRGALALVDCGVESGKAVLRNVEAAGLTPGKCDQFVVFLTHCHVDHVGAAHQVKEAHPHAQFVAHDADKAAIEGEPGTTAVTAAAWYGIRYVPVRVDVVVKDPVEKLLVGDKEFVVVHCPGHTPGSLAVYVDLPAEGAPRGFLRVLFGQDVHGPFMREFGSDLSAYAKSMERLLELEADVLCEGHYGVYEGADQVRSFITRHLESNRRRA